jgi:DNA polymerase-1
VTGVQTCALPISFRSFYAFAKGGDGGLSTKAGVPTSVTYGFLKALLEN